MVAVGKNFVKASGSRTGIDNTGNRIDHNLFTDITRISDNGQEPVQLGQDQATYGSMALYAVVEYNYFLRTDGDSEIISNKSSNNIIRYNVFRDSKAELNLRGGSSALVQGNYMSGCYSGIIVFGDNHRITDNYIINCGSGIRLDAAQYNTGDFISRELSGTYQAASGCIIEKNIIINSKEYAFYFSRHLGTVHEKHLKDKKPSENSFFNNIIIKPGKNAVFDNGSINTFYKENIVWPEEKLLIENSGNGFIFTDPYNLKDIKINRELPVKEAEAGPGWKNKIRSLL